MEMETLFVEQRWNIIEQLSRKEQSPLQLANELNTTMANISQQLRLLEASNLVSKEKVKNRDKGKPRSLFSLSEDFAYLISAMNDFADKRLLKVNDHNKATLKIWFLENKDLHYPLQKLYWDIEENLSKISCIAVDESSGTVYFVSDNSKQIENSSKNSSLQIKILPQQKLVSIASKTNLTPIHDPDNMLVGGDI